MFSDKVQIGKEDKNEKEYDEQNEKSNGDNYDGLHAAYGSECKQRCRGDAL